MEAEYFQGVKCCNMLNFLESKYLPSISQFSNVNYIILANINDYSLPDSFSSGKDVTIFVGHRINTINSQAFSKCNIKTFIYCGTKDIKGDFLKNAKSCDKVITTTQINSDSVGGVKITEKVNDGTTLGIDLNGKQLTINSSNDDNPSDDDSDGKDNKNNDETNKDKDNNEEKKNGNKKNGGKVAGIVIAVIFIIAVAVISFFVYKNVSNKEGETSSQEGSTLSMQIV